MPVFFLRKLSKFLLLGDYLVISLCYVFWVYFFINPVDKAIVQIDYKLHIIILLVFWSVLARLTGLYKNTYYRESTDHFSLLSKTLFGFVLFFLLYINLLYSQKVSFYFSAKYLVSITLMMAFNRMFLLLLRKNYRKKIHKQVNTILIGNNHFSQAILANEEVRVLMGIKGFYAFEKLQNNGQYQGSIDCFLKDIESGKIDNIILCDDNIDEAMYHHILNIAEQNMIRMYIVPDFKYVSSSSHSLDIINGIPFLTLMPEPLSNTENQFIKRTFDLIFSLLVLVFLLSWLIPIVALIIKLESRGPIFFLQKRSGLKNEPFNCIKFRSMAINSHADHLIATKNDARVTKFGAFMRKTSIDELPQFINVFIGNMSVVGPRPHMLSQTKQYSQITRKYMLRHMIKPGITGWAQVMGSRGEIFSHEDMAQRVKKDIWYIQNWSFFLDLKIIFLTFYNIVKGDDQAY